MEQKKEPVDFFNKLPTLSIMVGIFGLTSCCYPPLQLVLGAAAVMLAYLSKNGKPLSAPAVAGTVLGVASIVLSIFIFLQYIWVMDLMADPANSAMMKEVFRQYRELFDSISQTQPST